MLASGERDSGGPGYDPRVLHKIESQVARRWLASVSAVKKANCHRQLSFAPILNLCSRGKARSAQQDGGSWRKTRQDVTRSHKEIGLFRPKGSLERITASRADGRKKMTQKAIGHQKEAIMLLPRPLVEQQDLRLPSASAVMRHVPNMRST